MVSTESEPSPHILEEASGRQKSPGDAFTPSGYPGHKEKIGGCFRNLQ